MRDAVGAAHGQRQRRRNDRDDNNTTMMADFEYRADPPPSYTRHVTDSPNLHCSLQAVGILTMILALVAVTLRLFA